MALKRLDKCLSELGIASRSELKQIIKAGRVCVDGITVTNTDAKISDESSIELDGVIINKTKLRYFMLNKPSGYISATEDREKTVLDLLSPEHKRLGLFPVGRLDKDTEGLLLLTNDGDFAHRVISPRSGIKKLYLAEIDGVVDDEDVMAFKKGIVLSDGTHCLPAELTAQPDSHCLVCVMEGKYHQVKRMLASRGKPVIKLRRISVGALELTEDMPLGAYRELSEDDLCKVLNKNNM